ncbi:MAG: YdcF family protein [Oscillospiraceae bacterium]|nr:YdcF family protein [Oscillospiraceae bacterium]
MPKHNAGRNYHRTLISSMTARNVRRKRRLRFRVLIILLAAALVGYAALGALNLAVVTSARARILPQEDAAALGNIDAILVLGAQVMPNGSPSHVLEDRMKRGVALMQSEAAPVLLVSGDHGQKQYDEVTCMKQYAVDNGIPSNIVFMDHAGFSTYESLYRARDVFQCKRVIIVTQSYHLSRALYIANALGLDAYGVASDYRTYATQPYMTVREWAARAKDFFKCMFQPKPTFLGTPIPLNLDGNVTNDPDQIFTAREKQ